MQEDLGDGSVPTFQQHNPMAYKVMTSAFLTYIKLVSLIENGTLPPMKERNFLASDLTYSSSGLPQVPMAIKNNNGIERNHTQQQIIRIYLTRHYSGLY
jgi:hypothetical protein